MTDRGEVRCCGRSTTRIGIERSTTALTLHTCSACGRHLWRAAGEPVDRAALLAALRPAPAGVRPAPPRPVAPVDLRGSRGTGGRRPIASRAAPAGRLAGRTVQDADDARRTELRGLLTAFTVHGTSS